MSKDIVDIPASIHSRLKNVAKKNNEFFENILYRYVVERFLYRLGKSEYKNEFYLKGAFLFAIWEDIPHRTTRDIDFLGITADNIKILEKKFRKICSLNVSDDGLIFNPQSIKGEEIREGQSYGGIRLKQIVMLGKAKIVLQIDVGFGDAVFPGPEENDVPTLLDMPAPKIQSYPLCTVIAEKLETLVVRGIENSRMKDFYDLWCLTKKFKIEKEELLTAIEKTFHRRKTLFPDNEPIALTKDFALNKTKHIQWNAFIRKNQINTDNTEFIQIILYLNNFFVPILKECSEKFINIP